MNTENTETTTDEQCINCGDEFDGDGIYNGNSVKEEAVGKLSDGASVPLNDVIKFDDGPYCSLDCSINSE